MLNGYENNEKVLVGKISELKAKITQLQEELNNKDAVEEEKEELLQQIATLTEQLHTAEEDLRETQTENERLAAELEAANNKVDELKVVLDGLTFNDEPLTTEELAAITGGNSEIQSILTKTELNKIINTSKHSINKVTFK